MAQDLVLTVDDDVLECYRLKALAKGITLEEEVRAVLEANKPFTPEEKVMASRQLRAQFAAEDWDTKAAIRWGRDDEFVELQSRIDAA